MAVCNRNVKRILEKLRKNTYSRKDVYEVLERSMGGLAYVAAPTIIPEGVTEAGFYTKDGKGKAYRVLHLSHRICSNGQMTYKTDWQGIEPGEYLDAKSLCIVTVKTDGPVTDRQARAPTTRILHKGLVEFDVVGDWDGRFIWNAGLGALEFDDDKATVTYFDRSGKVRNLYDWMPDDTDEDREHYDNYESRMDELFDPAELNDAADALLGLIEEAGGSIDDIGNRIRMEILSIERARADV